MSDEVTETEHEQDDSLVSTLTIHAFDIDVPGAEHAGDAAPILDEAVAKILDVLDDAGVSGLSVRLVELLRDAIEVSDLERLVSNEKGEKEIPVFRDAITQMIPAQPDTHVVYCGGDNDDLMRVPVVAWGIYTRTQEWMKRGSWTKSDRPGTSKVVSGPLVVGFDGELVPADSTYEVVGIRMGPWWWRLDDCHREESEPSDSPFRSPSEPTPPA